jgi:DNA-binding transcriptional ArsR family regulator
MARDMSLEPSEVFKVLGVETRIKIVELLKTRGPLGVNALAETLGISPAAVSQHLKVLRHAGLVTPQRKGYWIPYSLNEESLESCRCMVNEVCSCDCDTTTGWKRQGLTGLSLEDLQTYEKELQMELERVQRGIARQSAKKR